MRITKTSKNNTAKVTNTFPDSKSKTDTSSKASMGTFNLFMYEADEDVSKDWQPDINSQAFNPRMTKREMKEIQEEFRRQKEIYERQNGVLMSEERKKALYRL